MDDLYVAWMLLGWMLAFWAGRDLQVRMMRWWRERQELD
jgi:hypothetical protein